MSPLPPLEVGDFAPFFRAVHDRDPFPWQERLIKRVAETGWPKVLDLPTGTGKTAALDVAVFALALDAGRTPRSAPLRIIYVVDRRTIVDQAYARAKTIRKALIGAENDVIRRVRERLAQYAREGVPLRTAMLRGGVARDDMWARTPDQPLVAVSTVDQVGSRLLFRGYGLTDSMKPVHAGLLGCDVLYLLDEVHLSQPFRETLEAIGGRYRTWVERPLPGHFVVVEMSATPGEAAPNTFRLEDVDLQHPVLSARLRSSKPVSLVSANPKGFPKEVEKHVLSMLARPAAAIAVVVNRVKSARELHARLCELVPVGPSAVHLLTGRMRPFDRDALEWTLFERIRAGRTRSADDQPVVIVATQSIEAGSDFDFDGLVTECASLDALRQRFGRLDRLGELSGSARGVIVARTDSLEDDPVYGDATGKTWDWLQSSAVSQIVDFGIAALSVPQDASERGLLTPKLHAPILLPSHLDAWVQTAPVPDPDPDVALWLHGPQRGAADVQIIWRADLTEELLDRAAPLSDDASEAAEVVVGMVEALPPVSAEAMSVPFLAAKRWLEGRSEPESFDVEGARDIDDDVPEQSFESRPRAVVVWQGEFSRVVRANHLHPGQTIVVPSSYGGIGHGNWAPASRVPVKDVAELAALRHGRRATLRLHEAVVQALFDGGIVDVPKPGVADSEMLNDREVVVDWIESQDASTANDLVRDLLDRLRGDAKAIRVERLPLAPGEDADEYFLLVGRRRAVQTEDGAAVDERASTDGSGSSFTGVEVTLADHLAGVAEMASGFAERTGLSDDLVADLRLAAEWHDAGKADPRFQRWLHGGSEFKALVQAAPLAKGKARLVSRSAMRLARERAGYPGGARHELTSLVLMQSASDPLAMRAGDWTLVQHIVASHHGHGRPLAPWALDPEPVDVTFSRDGIKCNASSAHELACFDSGIAERFWQMVRKYGWWGLAWLETLIRLADHRQSEHEQTSGGKRSA